MGQLSITFSTTNFFWWGGWWRKCISWRPGEKFYYTPHACIRLGINQLFFQLLIFYEFFRKESLNFEESVCLILKEIYEWASMHKMNKENWHLSTCEVWASKTNLLLNNLQTINAHVHHLSKILISSKSFWSVNNWFKKKSSPHVQTF